MPTATMSFIVPEDVTALAQAFHDENLSLDGHPDLALAESVEAYVGALSSLKGQRAYGEAEDVDDPIEAISEAKSVLLDEDCDFLITTSSFVERSRGDRYDGRIYLKVGDIVRELGHPWSDGDPSLDERSMRTAGFDEVEIGVAMERFFPQTPTPRP
jgi:hypothetical protein